MNRSDDSKEKGQVHGASQGKPPEQQGSGEGSGSAFSAMLKKRREGQHGVPEREDEGREDAASTN